MSELFAVTLGMGKDGKYVTATDFLRDLEDICNRHKIYSQLDHEYAFPLGGHDGAPVYRHTTRVYVTRPHFVTVNIASHNCFTFDSSKGKFPCAGVVVVDTPQGSALYDDISGMFKKGGKYGMSKLIPTRKISLPCIPDALVED